MMRIMRRNKKGLMLMVQTRMIYQSVACRVDGMTWATDAAFGYPLQCVYSTCRSWHLCKTRSCDCYLIKTFYLLLK
jgi:hypothetical protein